jgi:hypothetical protein
MGRLGKKLNLYKRSSEQAKKNKTMEIEKSKFITEQDIRFAVAIIVFLVPIFLCYADITKQLALIQQSLLTIKSNDLAHIEIELTDIKARNVTADDRQRNMELQVTQIQSSMKATKSDLDIFNADNKK